MNTHIMTYESVKIMHIFTAALLVTSLAMSFLVWKKTADVKEAAIQLQTNTGLFIFPLAILQLVSGFTIISLKHYPVSQLWIKGSILGFFIVIGSWIGFLFFLKNGGKSRYLQKSMLIICAFTLVAMIFFMASKICI